MTSNINFDQANALKLIELFNKTKQDDWMPPAPKHSDEVMSGLINSSNAKQWMDIYKKKYADFDGDEMDLNVPIKGVLLQAKSKKAKSMKAKLKKNQSKPYSDYKLINNPSLPKIKANDSHKQPQTFTPILPIIVDSWGYKSQPYYYQGGKLKGASVSYYDVKSAPIDKLYASWFGAYDEYYSPMPESLLTKKKPQQPYLMLTEGQSAATDFTNWELHAQSVIKRQRKFKKLKKQRTDNRHYNLGLKPTQSQQQINHNRQQGHNKTQFCSRR